MGNITIFDGDGAMYFPAYWVQSECESIIYRLNDIMELMSEKIRIAQGKNLIFSCAEIVQMDCDLISICYDSIFYPMNYYANIKSTTWQDFWTEFYRRSDNAFWRISQLSYIKFMKLDEKEENTIKAFEGYKDYQYMCVPYERLEKCNNQGEQIIRSQEDSLDFIGVMKNIVVDLQLIFDYCAEKIKEWEDATSPYYENIKRKTEI